ncbi:MAG: hypothetical protein KDD61_07660 [Bdellovibrionales bacterium]|nr:hypothetical protein [Bdellovibrionales bacterium]
MKLAMFGFLVFLFTFPRVASSATLESVNHQTISQLQENFQKGHVPTLKHLLKKSKWTCKLYGVRSKLQTYQRDNFYEFKKSPKPKVIFNYGAQLFTSYKVQPNSLVASKGSLAEHIKETEDGKIISEMSIAAHSNLEKFKKENEVSSAIRPNSVVVAYTTCQ